MREKDKIGGGGKREQEGCYHQQVPEEKLLRLTPVIEHVVRRPLAVRRLGRGGAITPMYGQVLYKTRESSTCMRKSKKIRRKVKKETWTTPERTRLYWWGSTGRIGQPCTDQGQRFMEWVIRDIMKLIIKPNEWKGRSPRVSKDDGN